MATPATLANGRTWSSCYGVGPTSLSVVQNLQRGNCQPVSATKDRSFSLHKCGLGASVSIQLPASSRWRRAISSSFFHQCRTVQAVGTLVKESTSVTKDEFVASLIDRLLQPSSSSGSGSGGESVLLQLREKSVVAAREMRWPGNKDEAYRFTDLKSLRVADIVRASPAPHEPEFDLTPYTFEEANKTRVTVLDGIICPSLSTVESLPAGVVLTSLLQLPAHLLSIVALHLGNDTNYGAAGLDLFTALNGAGLHDVLVLIVPEGVKLEKPIHVVYASKGVEKKGAALSTPVQMSHPRLLAVLERDAHAVIVEEFAGIEGGPYWTNQVAEFVLAEGAHLVHGYIQAQARDAYHIKKTVVSQAGTSVYSLVEAEMGGRLSRHNMHVEQRGSDTETELSSFLLAGHQQLHDLHSSIALHHPRGKTRQLHKCIVTHSTGHGVFDGNVQVNRYAQETDAGQLSRNLLLAPRATVNVKPNLQIIADAVKCTHGATISDLEEEQMFYFRARGIDEQTARSALVFSFGAEVIHRLPYQGLQLRMEATVKAMLAAEGAMDPSMLAALTIP